MSRGTNPNSLKNLEKGRTKGKGKGKQGNYTDDANTFAALYKAIGSLDLNETAWAHLSDIGITKAWCKAHGITQYRKLLKAVGNYLDDSPAMVKEVMERLEGKVTQPNANVNVDLTQLDEEQLTMLANGTDIYTVLAVTRSRGTGEASETEG